MKLLCLHGFGQNARIFQKQTSVLRKALMKKGVECVYVDAPHILPPIPDVSNDGNNPNKNNSNNEPNNEPVRAWWRMNEETQEYVGLDLSLKYLSDLYISTLASTAEHEPFIGVLGFSQGAVFASIVCNHPILKKGLKFGIFVSGFIARDFRVGMIDKVCALPTLHIIGENDQIVPADRSKDLFHLFTRDPKVAAQMLMHSGGHYLPQTAEFRNEITLFVMKQVSPTPPAAAADNTSSSNI